MAEKSNRDKALLMEKLGAIHAPVFCECF